MLVAAYGATSEVLGLRSRETEGAGWRHEDDQRAEECNERVLTGEEHQQETEHQDDADDDRRRTVELSLQVEVLCRETSHEGGRRELRSQSVDHVYEPRVGRFHRRNSLEQFPVAVVGCRH